MWARFTVLSDTPIASAIVGCVIPLSRSNTIWMRWRCSGCPFQPSAVFKRRICFLVHLTICSSESDQMVRENHTPTLECNSLRHSVPQYRSTSIQSALETVLQGSKCSKDVRKQQSKERRMSAVSVLGLGV